jgi:hypothetical protein
MSPHVPIHKGGNEVLFIADHILCDYV